MILDNYDRGAATGNEIRTAAGQETDPKYENIKTQENGTE
jgi:hypothetical protein